TACELTRSHVVQVFLISTDGNALVPFCDWPDAADTCRIEPVEPARVKPWASGEGLACDVGLDSEGRILHHPVIHRNLDNRSIIAWVAKHGKPCFIGNFDDRNAFKPYPGLEAYLRTYKQTRSECCVPLFITGRLMGTLTFQSIYTNTYREQRHLIEAIAELIGLTFAHERRSVEQEILENHAVLAGRKHDLLHLMEDLLKLVDSQPRAFSPESWKKQIREMLIIANKKIEGINDPTEKPRSGEARSVTELVHGQVPRVKEVEVVYGMCLDTTFRHEVVAADSVIPFTHALYEVLQNAKKGVNASAGEIQVNRWAIEDSRWKNDPLAAGKLVIHCEKRWLGGRPYAMIRVRNRCVNTGIFYYQHQLSRQTIQAGPRDRPHLGSLIAGSLLRSVGGEMSFAMEEVPPDLGNWFIATTQIEVKLEPGGTDG
ncbi:MAG TPA: GAF domain-containing protein, partial [Gemmata sp.]|nr:GAF domain-containing protein [Gemmata sp.]